MIVFSKNKKQLIEGLRKLDKNDLNLLATALFAVSVEKWQKEKERQDEN